MVSRSFDRGGSGPRENERGQRKATTNEPRRRHRHCDGAGIHCVGVSVDSAGRTVAETPWSELPELLASPRAIEALRLSLVSSILAAAVATILGVPLAWVLARREFRGQRLLRGVVLLPLVLPPVVGGVALLTAFGRRGLLGQYLYDWFGMQLPFSTAGVVMAEAFVALPFLVLTVEGALRGIDPRFEMAARTGGAPRTVVFRITVR